MENSTTDPKQEIGKKKLKINNRKITRIKEKQRETYFRYDWRFFFL